MLLGFCAWQRNDITFYTSIYQWWTTKTNNHNKDKVCIFFPTKRRFVTSFRFNAYLIRNFFRVSRKKCYFRNFHGGHIKRIFIMHNRVRFMKYHEVVWSEFFLDFWKCVSQRMRNEIGFTDFIKFRKGHFIKIIALNIYRCSNMNVYTWKIK